MWLHTGTDIVASAGQPVAAAADGQIIGYMIDATFRGGVLVRHPTTTGVVITQYWHVWLRSGFTVGSSVKRGQVFADVADMGSKTHFHFAVFNGDYEPHAWNGALPPSACSGFPAFPYRFVDPTAFIAARGSVHLAPKALKMFRDIMALDEVLETHTVAGDDCYLIKVRTDSITSLNTLVGKLKEPPLSLSTRTTIVMQTHCEKVGGIILGEAL